MRILILHKGGIGDVVFALPMIRDLKQGYTNAHVTVLTHDAGADVMRACPDVDAVHALGAMDNRSWLPAAKHAVRDQDFDIAVTAVRSPRAALFMHGTGAPLRCGFASGPEQLLHTHRASLKPFEVVFARRFQRLAEALDLPIGAPVPTGLTFTQPQLVDARTTLCARGWDGVRPLVALHLGGGWPTKQWPLEHFVELGKRLGRSHSSRTRAPLRAVKGEGGAAAGSESPTTTVTPLRRPPAGVAEAAIVLQGGPEDVSRGEAVAWKLANAGVVVLNGVGDSVADSLAQATYCRATVGLDSGLSHAAAAAGVPTVHLFGPNDPASVVLADHQRILTTHELECRPCNREGRRQCPKEHHRCMTDITPDMVLEALGDLTQSPPLKRAS